MSERVKSNRFGVSAYFRFALKPTFIGRIGMSQKAIADMRPHRHQP